MASRRDFGLEEILDFFPFAPVAQFAQGLAFDLADTFTGDVEVLAYFFQCARTAIFEAEAQVEDFAFPVGETGKDVFDLFFQQDEGGGVIRGDGFRVFDEIAEVRVFFFANRSGPGRQWHG